MGKKATFFLSSGFALSRCARLRRGSTMVNQTESSLLQKGEEKKPTGQVEAKDWIGLLAIPIVIGFLALGTFMFVELEGFGIRDSLYFCVTMLTTVGYGDFSPETSPGKVAAILFILIGLSLTTTCIGIIFSRAADLAARKDAGPVALPTVKGEFMKMVRALLLILLVNTAGASWAHFHDGFDWLDGFYWAFITSTSVGFGDLETSDATRNFQIGFMILAVIIVANGFGTLVEVIGIVGKIEMEDVEQVMELFKHYDIDNSGYLTIDDVVQANKEGDDSPDDSKPVSAA